MVQVPEDKLKALLEKAGKATATSMRVTPTMVSLMVYELLQARKEIADLNKEADWLAHKAMWECDQCHSEIRRDCFLFHKAICNGNGVSAKGVPVGVAQWRMYAKVSVREGA